MKVDHLPISTTRTAVVSASDEEGGLQLGQVLGVLRRKALLILSITTAVVFLAQLKARTDKPIYSAGFDILTKSVTAEGAVVSSVPDTFSSREQGGENSSGQVDATKIRVLQSPALLDPLLEQLKTRYPDLTYAALVQSLRIVPDQPDILAVSFRSEDPRLVRDVLDLLSKQYLTYSLEERQRDIRQGIIFVEEQLPKLNDLVSKQQERLQKFRQQYNLIDPELQAQQLSAQAGTLAQSRLETQTQLNESRLLFSEVQNELRTQTVENAATSALSDNPRYQKLLDQLLEVDSQLAQDSALYLDSSPELQVVLEQRSNLIPLLQREGIRVQREVASQIQDLENRSQAIDQSIADVNRQVKLLSMVTREYTDIQRELEIATDNLNQFLSKREGLRIDASQRQVPWQLLTPPGDPIPSSTSTKRSLVLGFGLGLLLGTGAALLADRLSNLIHTTREIKEITKLPLLGAIPFNRSLATPAGRVLSSPAGTGEVADADEAFAAWSQISNPFQESFRALYANLRFISPDAPIRSLVVTSPIASSGKTTTAFHLARAAAAAGQRVLLIDADLRRPQLQNYADRVERYGLTDVVSSELDFMDMVCPAAGEKNLSLLLSGSLPPDPSRILASQSMQQFMQKASEAFDLVIYDTPPLLGFADAYFLSPYTDGLLLVVRVHQLKRVFLEQTMEDLRVSAATILGTVANATEEPVVNSDSYYHYYAADERPPSGLLASVGRQVTRYSKPVTRLWQKTGQRR